MSKLVWKTDANRIAANIAWNNWLANNAGSVRKSIQANTPLDLGGLRGSGNYKLIPGGKLGTKIMRYVHRAHYAMSVHEGHGEILPVNGKVLTWLDKLTGKRVFVTRVGPTKPRPWITSTLRQLGLRVRKK